MKFSLLFLLAFACKLSWSHNLEKALCVDSAFDLSCADGYLLEIVGLNLGDSSCYKTNCCPKDHDCRKPVSYDHSNYVKRVCNGQRRCRFNVEKAKIGCVWYAPNNDYELVKYQCVRDPKSTSTTMTSPRLTPTDRSMIASLQESLVPQESSSNKVPTSNILSFTTPKRIDNLNLLTFHDNYGTAQQLQQKSDSEDSAKEHKLVNLEPVVIPVIAGLIITTLIISIACIVTKNIKLKYLRQKALNQDHNLTGIYLQPISYQTLMRSCADEPTCQAMNQCNQECVSGCDTYDSIKDVCTSLDDGYLKPADVIGESSQQKIQEEDRYILA